MAMSINPGTRLGQYEVIEAIGAGGMGELRKGWKRRMTKGSFTGI
jgi:hypothetical protein